jgi:translation initiation factor IF-3
MFRGREMDHKEFGRDLLARVIEATKDLCQEKYDSTNVPIEGRNMTMVLSPTK